MRRKKDPPVIIVVDTDSHLELEQCNDPAFYERVDSAISQLSLEVTLNTLLKSFVNIHYKNIKNKYDEYKCLEYKRYIFHVLLLVNEIKYSPVNRFGEEFILFSKVISTKYEFSSKLECQFVTWKLILNTYKSEAMHIFRKKYNNLFTSSNLSLDEYMTEYIRISDSYISTDDEEVYCFINFLREKNLLRTDVNYSDQMEYINKWIIQMEEMKLIVEYESKLINGSEISDFTVQIESIDKMSGTEFETFIYNLLIKLGYSASVTKATGDQGIDIIARKNGYSFGIQAKCYSSSVSNSAIQEVVAGLSYYELDVGLVVTNNYFTKSAMDLAKSNNVLLWDRDVLISRMNEVSSMQL